VTVGDAVSAAAPELDWGIEAEQHSLLQKKA
jgi:hypothetical protein